MLDFWMIGICVLSGMLSGLCAGLFGLGGGIVIVPTLHFLFLHQGFPETVLMQCAIATSLFSILFIGAASAWGHYRIRALHFPLLYRLLPGILIGSVLGACFAGQLPSTGLQRLFALFELAVAWQLMTTRTSRPFGVVPGCWGLIRAGVGIGTCASLLGVGGGTLAVPFLLWCGLSLRTAIAVSAACGVPIALLGSLSFMFLGWEAQGLPDHTLGYVYWPVAGPIVLASLCTVPLGVRLAHELPARQLRCAFATALVLVACSLLV